MSNTTGKSNSTDKSNSTGKSNSKLAYWANLINLSVNSNFTLNDFLNTYHLSIQMLLCMPNADIACALIKCKDFDVTILNDIQLIQFRWEMLKLTLHYQPNQIEYIKPANYSNQTDGFDTFLRERMNQLFEGITDYCNLEEMFDNSTKYDLCIMYKMIVDYCYNSYIFISTEAMQFLLKSTINHFRHLEKEQIAIIVKYSFKTDLMCEYVILELIEWEYVELLKYAVKLYQKSTIRLPTRFYNNTPTKNKLLYYVHQKIPIINTNKLVYQGDFQKTINTDALVCAVLWMDEKQRFTNIKDTTLLHLKPLLIYIGEFIHEDYKRINSGIMFGLSDGESDGESDSEY